MLFKKTILIADADFESVKKAMNELSLFGTLPLNIAIDIKLVAPGTLDNRTGSDLTQAWNELPEEKFKIIDIEVKEGERFGGVEILIAFEVWNETAYQLLEESGFTTMQLVGEFEEVWKDSIFVKHYKKILGIGYGINELLITNQLNFGKNTIYYLPENIIHILNNARGKKDASKDFVTLINIPNKYGALNQQIVPGEVFSIACVLHQAGVADFPNEQCLEIADGLEVLNRVIRTVWK